MKKFLFLLLFLVVTGTAVWAQSTITLTFTGRDQNNAHVRLDNVTIQNLTRGWTEAIFFPDTVYTLTIGTGISDYADGNEMQVMPNPFDGRTQLNLCLAQGESVRMVIVDITGKKCAEYNGRLSEGDNIFEIMLTTPQTYILSVQTSEGMHSVKMVNTGRAGANQISLVGGESNTTKVKISSTRSHVFELGDEMCYTGYSQQSNGLIPSTPITQNQYESEAITLHFTLGNDAELPIVATVAASNIGMNTATTGGNVFSDGGAPVTARGVCYSVTPNPTLSETHTIDGTGTGAFTSNLANLVENTTYYVRAYATNSAGTAYGQEVTFTTTCANMQLTITGDTSLTYGDSVTLTVSGAVSYLWNTGATTASITVRPTTSMMYSVTGTNPDGCTGTASVLVSVYPILPTVTTATITNITENAANGGGNVTSDGGAMITARGVCWATATNPTIAGSHTTDGTGTGTFTSSVTDLVANTTYYVRAYATNSAGTAYGNEVTFITSGPAVFDCGTSQLTDLDGNTYNTVLIGTQCWMAENLRTTRFSDGTLIPEGTTSSPYVSYRYTPNNDVINIPTYGYLYNQAAVVRGSVGGSQSNPSGVQGVCPAGWHVPSHAEWEQLIDTVRSKSQYWCNNSSYNIGKALSFTSGWMSSTYTCAIGNNQAANNATGFGVKPAGAAFYDDYDFYGLGRFALYWCSDVYSDYGYNMIFEYDESEPWYSSAYSSRGMSVRCLQDRLPVVTTAQVGSVTFTTSVCGGEVTNSGASALTARGVCWSTDESPTVADNVTNDGIGLGTFTSTMTGLSEGTVYYVRAYATNLFGTSYGDVYRFVTKATPPVGDNIPCPGMPTVTDVDNNVYNTVKIGSQCWMKENLKTTRYADGTLIPLGSSTSSTTPYRYNPDNSAANVSTYGYLYNWPAVVNGVTGSDDKPSCLQGICPVGWHVPSDAEWTELTDYVSSQPYYRCDGYPNAIAKALASPMGWYTTSGICKVGSDTSSNNSTGFSAIPAGMGNPYSSYTLGYSSYFWSATCGGNDYYYDDYSYRRCLSYSNDGLVTNSGSSSYYYYNQGAQYEGYSVRCLRDTIYLPTVITAAISDSSTNAAVGGGDVLYSGGAYVINKGLCWSTSPNPTLETTSTYGSVTGFLASYDFLSGQGSPLSNQYVNVEDYQNGLRGNSSNNSASMGRGAFTYTILGLQPGTTYYVRAYAINVLGSIAYGNEVSFTTLPVPAGDAIPCPGTPTVTDYDGNVYNTVQIGNQCWMKENLRTTHFADGTLINISSGSETSSVTPRRYYPSGNSYYVNQYGYLYNWPAVMYGGSSISSNPSGLQGVCPDGWHVPSDSEWVQLIDYVSNHNIYLCNDINTAKAFASQQNWQNSTVLCAVGNTLYFNNATGFSVLPSGNYTGSYTGIGSDAHFWSSTEANGYARTYNLYYNYANIISGNEAVNNALSVRCVKGSGFNMPVVTTDFIKSITDSSIVVGGEVLHEGGDTVTERGICWSSIHVPTIEDNHLCVGTGLGTFSAIVSDLTENEMYYVRAYATNSMGTKYGWVRMVIPMAVSSGDAQSCTGIPIVTDVDGNEYNTVKIGTQCWMKENLRVTRFQSGIPITYSTGTSNTTPFRRFVIDSSMVSDYGYLYNWPAVMNGSNGSNSVPSNVQGVCPTGWHVPSKMEWDQLKTYYYSQPAYYSVPVSETETTASFYVSMLSLMGYSNNSTFNHYNDLYHFDSMMNATGFSSTRMSENYKYGSTSMSTNNQILSVSIGLTNFNTGINSEKSSWMFVRCLQDRITLSITTDSIRNITQNSVDVYATLTRDEGTSPIERGVCWGVSSSPDINDSHAADTGGLGTYTYQIQDLLPSTQYYVRAYATNSDGIAYGEVLTFTTPYAHGQSCPNQAVISDYDGNYYNTVRIGNQCWMKENLRTTHYADGYSIVSVPAAVVGTPNCSVENIDMYGRTYNWDAFMRDGNSSSSSNPSGIQGVCPNGWHMPSNAEWKQLRDFVGVEPMFTCGDSTKISKSLIVANEWTNTNAMDTCSVNYNATGFSALPAGHTSYSYSSSSGYTYNGYTGCGTSALFGSTTQSSTSLGYTSMLANAISSTGNSYTSGLYKRSCLSVRCVKAVDTHLTVLHPVVSTIVVDYVAHTSAKIRSAVVSDGGLFISRRGVCWSTSHNPTINDNYSIDGNGVGVYNSMISGLEANTTYYVRAYAVDSKEIVYGDELMFRTGDEKSCLGTPLITDYDGNIYGTVQIGDQCWMRENLRTEHYRYGSSISLGSTASTSTAYRSIPGSDATNIRIYGYNYNWTAATGDICPTGWHVPSDWEWSQLTDYLGAHSEYFVGTDTTNVAKSLSAQVGWTNYSYLDECSVGFSPAQNNITGFTAIPFSNNVQFWSSTQNTQQYTSNQRFAWSRSWDSFSCEVGRNSLNKSNYLSIRCCRDNMLSEWIPKVETASIKIYLATGAIGGGTVISDGGVPPIIARGVCWNLTGNPTLEDNYTTDSTGIGSFISTLTGLTAGTTYYVRAYVTNSVGTAYGDELQFKYFPPCMETPLLTDYDGNTYNTIKIGNQCWMRDNLRTTRYADGTTIPLGTSSSTIMPYRYKPGNNIDSVSTYGYLYNWSAVMHGTTSSIANPSGVQGICPTGWHVPSDAEWTLLTDYVGSQIQYQCDNNSENIAKALASTSGWRSSTNTCAVGNNPSVNNETGFSALPAGSYDVGYYFGYGANFWSATENSGSNAYGRYLYYYYANVYRSNYGKNNGLSVRCVRD